MNTLPVIIKNKYAASPNIKDSVNVSLVFDINESLGSFYYIDKLQEILKNIDIIFKSRFSIFYLLNTLTDNSCVTLDAHEKELLKNIMNFSLGAYKTNNSIYLNKIKDIVLVYINKYFYDAIKNNSISDVKDISFTMFNKISNCYMQLVESADDIFKLMSLEKNKKLLNFDLSPGVVCKVASLIPLLDLDFKDVLADVNLCSVHDDSKVNKLLEYNKTLSLEEARVLVGDISLNFLKTSDDQKNTILENIKNSILKKLAIGYDELLTDVLLLDTYQIKTKIFSDITTKFDNNSCGYCYYPSNILFGDNDPVEEQGFLPSIYILDECVYSIYLDQYASNFIKNSKKNTSLTLSDIKSNLEDKLFNIFKNLDGFEDAFSPYWSESTDPINVYIFDKNGDIKSHFFSFSEFLNFFYEHNPDIYNYYINISSNKKLYNFYYYNKDTSSDSNDGLIPHIFNGKDIDILVSFIQDLYIYLENNGIKSRLLNYTNLDHRMKIDTIIFLFNSILSHSNILYTTLNRKYIIFLTLFFNILMRVIKIGDCWFGDTSLLSINFDSKIYASKIINVLEDLIPETEIYDLIIGTIHMPKQLVTKDIISSYLLSISFIFNYTKCDMKGLLSL